MVAKSRGYKSAAALHAGRAPPCAPSSAYIRIQRPGGIFRGARGRELGTQFCRGGDVLAVSNFPNTTASATTTNATVALIEEMNRAREAHTKQTQKLTALMATATNNDAPAPATRGGRTRVHYNPAVTRRVRYPPPLQGVKTTGVDRKGNAIHTSSTCTKSWVTHAEGDYLELEQNTGNRNPGWESCFM